jgi:hypothetical protein
MPTDAYPLILPRTQRSSSSRTAGCTAWPSPESQLSTTAPIWPSTERVPKAVVESMRKTSRDLVVPCDLIYECGSPRLSGRCAFAAARRDCVGDGATQDADLVTADGL